MHATKSGKYFHRFIFMMLIVLALWHAFSMEKTSCFLIETFWYSQFHPVTGTVYLRSWEVLLNERSTEFAQFHPQMESLIWSLWTANIRHASPAWLPPSHLMSVSTWPSLMISEATSSPCLFYQVSYRINLAVRGCGWDLLVCWLWLCMAQGTPPPQ